jgi:NADPH:quinone reductase-like Zn-dependent oxidoreductase
MSHILYKRVQLIGTLLRNRDVEYKTDLTQRFNERVLPLFRDKKIHPVVGNYLVVNWNQTEAEGMSKAHQIMETNQTIGRVVVGFDWTPSA